MRPNASVAMALVLLGACSSQTARQVPEPATLAVPDVARPDGETAAWWFRAGAAAAASAGAGREPARNIILFLGDGMSLPTVAAARILEGQRAGQPGEEHRLAFEEFPYTALSRTYNTDSQVPDSAGTMTALSTGAKARIGAIAVGQQVARGDCAAPGDELATLLEIAEAAGLSTGVVTTTRLTHATPAATYAHASDREWEADVDLAKRSPAAAAKGCRDIARQFVEFTGGDGIDVALAGGRRKFQTVDQADPEYPDVRGLRTDGRDLVAEWQRAHPEGKYIWNLPQLRALDLSRETRLLGLFGPDHLHYAHERAQDAAGEPDLAEMTRAAITVLRHNPKGFFLMVEGGRIDHAHHAGNAFRALDETIGFSDAVRAAREASPAADTLIVVTADHAHTMTFMGYGRRGNPILGKVSGSSGEERGRGLANDTLGLPYTTLGYASGPGYTGATREQPAGPKRFPHVNAGAQPATGRPDLGAVDTTDPDYLQESTLPLGSETHGGDDVGVWATGPGARAVHGSIEENVVFHLMLQSQPRLVRLLCALGDCEGGVPVRLPSKDALRAQARW